MDCAWVVGLRKDCKIALGLGRLGLLEGAGKAALLLSSMTLHDLSPCTVPHHAFLNPIALLVSLSVLDARRNRGNRPQWENGWAQDAFLVLYTPAQPFFHCDWILRLQEDWSRIVDCCGTGGEKGTTWHVCDGLIGIIRAAGLPGWDALKQLD